MTQPRGSAVESLATPSLLGLREFRAMNTKVQFFLRDIEDVGLLPAAEEVFHAMEARLSRFRPESELCRLNDRAGEETRVSDILFDVLERAQGFHRVTGGVFEPAVLGDLESAGYDRSFEFVRGSSLVAAAERPGATAGSIDQVVLDCDRTTVTAPAGLRIDLGGIGKGYTVDTVACLLEPARDFVVNAGGDIFASGAGPDGNGWLVAVDDPMKTKNHVALVRLHDEALATSTTAVRRWEREGRLLHHLIDPRTRRPSESGVLSVTVVARTASEADVFAKTALLLGPVEGPSFVEQRGTRGLFVMEGGAVVCTNGWMSDPQ